MAHPQASKGGPDDPALYFDTIFDAYMAETIQTEKEVPPYHSVDTAKIQRMAEAVVSFHPNKAELTCLTIMLEATLRIVKEEHSKKLEDIMREVAKEIKLVGVKPYHKQSYEEHEDAQANTLPAAAASAMDEEGIEDAGEPSKEAPGAAERS